MKKKYFNAVLNAWNARRIFSDLQLLHALLELLSTAAMHHQISLIRTTFSTFSVSSGRSRSILFRIVLNVALKFQYKKHWFRYLFYNLGVLCYRWILLLINLWLEQVFTNLSTPSCYLHVVFILYRILKQLVTEKYQEVISVN